MVSETDLDNLLSPLVSQLSVIDSEQVPLGEAIGRVLRGAIIADRDSPAANVSAMDGYALRYEDLQATEPLTVTGECVPGRPAVPLAQGRSVARIFTGAVVPINAELVVKREDTQELADSIILSDRARSNRMGENIRVQGENARAGSVVVDAGVHVHAGVIAAAANFGAAQLKVSRRLRVAVLTTGDELIDVADAVAPWQLRDSNGATIAGLLARYPWLDLRQCQRVTDNFETLCEVMRQLLKETDVLILTGGVSAGDFDFVPAALKQVGGHIAFHKLPIRPGKPILGGIGPQNQLVMGLPGNPVSAAVCALRFAVPLMSRMAGVNKISKPPAVALSQPDQKTLGLHWFRLVQTTAEGQLTLVNSQGSGDLVSLASSCGFIEVPPHQSGHGPWIYWPWPV